jgi:hypothetical protein
MIARTTLRRALDDPVLLGSVLVGESWKAWRCLLLATMGERLNEDELEIFRRFTGRTEAPKSRVEESLYLIGRRGGKDRAASVLACYLATLVDWSPMLAKGERGLVLCIGPDQRQAKITRDYIEGVLNASPLLRGLISNRTADTVELNNRISIEVRAASFRRLRGVTCVAVIATEAAFWQTDESASGNPDSEILKAVRPSLATTRGPLIIITSPYARKGEVWEVYRRHYGAQGDPLILVAQGASRDFNPTLSEDIVRRALERDHAAASAEYLAQFRTDIESFVLREAVEACVALDVRERAPISSVRYYGFVDPSGGSADSMTLAVGHREGDVVVVDALRERRPPFSPEAVVAEFSELLKSYRVSKITGDRYAGEWPRERFREHGISYESAAKPKSDLYRDLLPMINSRRIDLLDDARLVTQLVSLERRTGRGTGRDSIDHPPGAHDDLCNAVAGLAATTKRGSYLADLSWVSGPDPADSERAFQERRLCQHILRHSGYYRWRGL